MRGNMRELLLNAPQLMGAGVGLALAKAWLTDDGMAALMALAILAFFLLGVNYARAFDAGGYPGDAPPPGAYRPAPPRVGPKSGTGIPSKRQGVNWGE